MDGNGRWARQRHLPRIEGHRAGAESARVIIRTAGELGIKYLTLYAFSVENWNRPKEEVDALMKYLVHYLKTETPELNKNNVRLEVIGQIYRLPEAVQEHLRKSIATLSKNNGLTLIMALSYGGRTEIVDAVRSIAQKVKAGELDPPDITEQVFAQHLYTRNVPDPDVLIRTSGEMRVSNFLLWQISYTELVVTPDAVAGLPQAAIVCGARGIQSPAPPLWRVVTPQRSRSRTKARYGHPEATPSRGGPLPARPPLRTVRESFPSYGSSPHKAKPDLAYPRV